MMTVCVFLCWLCVHAIQRGRIQLWFVNTLPGNSLVGRRHKRWGSRASFTDCAAHRHRLGHPSIRLRAIFISVAARPFNFRGRPAARGYLLNWEKPTDGGWEIRRKIAPTLSDSSCARVLLMTFFRRHTTAPTLFDYDVFLAAPPPPLHECRAALIFATSRHSTTNERFFCHRRRPRHHVIVSRLSAHVITTRPIDTVTKTFFYTVCFAGR